jgi:hypothetical protein
MALAGLLIWLFFSPHRHAEQDQIRKIALDRTRELSSFSSCSHTIFTDAILNRHFATHQVGSFFGIQFLGCLLPHILGPVTICTTSKTLHLITQFPNMAFTFGIGVLGAKAFGLGVAPNPLLFYTLLRTPQYPSCHSTLQTPNCRDQPSLPSLLTGAGCNHE